MKKSILLIACCIIFIAGKAQTAQQKSQHTVTLRLLPVALVTFPKSATQKINNLPPAINSHPSFIARTGKNVYSYSEQTANNESGHGSELQRYEEITVEEHRVILTHTVTNK